MLAFLATSVASMTWSELAHVSVGEIMEPINKVIDFSFPEIPTEQQKIYEKITDRKTQINDKVSFVGIAECKFIDITGIENGFIYLQGTILNVHDSLFQNFADCVAINLVTCSGSIINNTVFQNFKNATGIYSNGCVDLRVTDSKFTEHEGYIDNCSAIIISNSAYVLLHNNVFEKSHLEASVVIVSDTIGCTIDKCTFDSNFHVLPGAVFVCSGDDTIIQNCDFKNNTTPSFSAAIFSLYSKISLINIFCQNNSVVEYHGEMPSIISNLGLTHASATITISTSYNIQARLRSTYIKDLFFDGNKEFDQNNDWELGDISVNIVDLYYDGGSDIEIEGLVQSTGDDLQFIFESSDYLEYETGVKELNRTESNTVPLVFTPDYAHDAFHPIIKQQIVKVYGSKTPSKMAGSISVLTIDSCSFEDCHIISPNHRNDDSLIKIDLDNMGAVCIRDSVFEDNKISSSVVQIQRALAVTVTDCTFSSNIAKRCAGILINRCGKVYVSSCSFDKNHLFLDGVLAIYNTESATVMQTTFRKNEAYVGTAALVFDNTTSLVKDVTFNRNELNLARDTLKKQHFDEPTNESILNPYTDLGIYFHPEIGVAVTIVNNSKVVFENVAFVNSDSTSTTVKPLVKYKAIDVYADSTSSAQVNGVCSNNKHTTFGLDEFDYNEDCEITPYYRNVFYAVARRQNITQRHLAREGTTWTVIEEKIETVVSSAGAFEISEESFKKPTPSPKPGSKGLSVSATATIIVVCLCFIVLVAGVGIIYYNRRKPEKKLKGKGKTEKLQALLKEPEEEGSGEEPDAAKV